MTSYLFYCMPSPFLKSGVFQIKIALTVTSQYSEYDPVRRYILQDSIILYAESEEPE